MKMTPAKKTEVNKTRLKVAALVTWIVAILLCLWSDHVHADDGVFIGGGGGSGASDISDLTSTGCDDGDVATSDGAGGTACEAIPAVDYGDVANTPTIPVATYDATVCASGCDYTDISTALDTEGDAKSIWIGRGTYTETDPVDINANSLIYIDGLVTINSDDALTATADGWTLDGGRLVFNTSKSSGNLCDFQNNDDADVRARLTCSFSGGAMTATGARIISITGAANSHYNVHVPEHTFSLNSASDFVIAILIDGTETVFDVESEGLAVAQAANAYGIYAQNVVRSVVNMISVDTTTTTGDTGKCLHTVSTDTYSVFRGVTRGCDVAGGNTKTGTGSIYTGLVE